MWCLLLSGCSLSLGGLPFVELLSAVASVRSCLTALRLDLVMLLLRHYEELVILGQTCTSRDEVTADDVLLDALELVRLARDGRIVEYLGGLLEGSRRDEASRL